MNKPIIGITMGDPAGVGPEIAVKAFNEKEITNICNPILIGDVKVINKTKSDLNLYLKINPVNKMSNALFEYGTIDVYDLGNVDMNKLEPGKVSAMAGNAAFEAVKTVIELALNKELDATVTGPLQKESMNLAGHKFSGHTEIFAYFTNTKKYAMLLVEENLRVIHVSTHVSLREACDMVKKERIIEVIDLLNNACKVLGIEKPKIAVAGLNPHAGDGGLFGTEEEKEIIPAISYSKNIGIDVVGPYPADTMFTFARAGSFDGCVAMYHDQGHIPFKLVGFQWDKEENKMKSVKGVNITLGLPIIRTSVDHGTAFDIAGKGIASPDALLLAVQYAVNMYFNKKTFWENKNDSSNRR